MKREYYISWYRLDAKDSYLIWFSTENDDGVCVDENHFVPSFANIKDLINHAKLNKIKIEEDQPILHNLDIIQLWLIENKSEIKDYNDFLNAWNLFDDISISTNGHFNTERKLTKKIYEKIFWSCNILGITPEGKSYEPIWTRKELKIVRETLSYGFQMFREKVKNQ